MLIKNNTAQIFTLKHKNFKTQLYPWQTRDVDPVFADDPTYRQGIASGCLKKIDGNANASQEAEKAVYAPSAPAGEEFAAEPLEEAAGATETAAEPVAVEVTTAKSSRKK